MKILTKEEEQAHYNATLKGGFKGLSIGLAAGGIGLWGATRRFSLIRDLTLPMKAFLLTSSSTFTGIIMADRSSRGFEKQRDPGLMRDYKDKTSRALMEAQARETEWQRFMDWGRVNRYKIVSGGWLGSIIAAFYIVNRNPYLTKAQKLVQARVYAQGLTLALLVATAAFETSDAARGKGNWEVVEVLDPSDPAHKHLIEKKIHHESYAGEDMWMDMVEAEEQRLAERKKAVQRQGAKDHAEGQVPGPDPKGIENKNRILSESKISGKVDYAEAQKEENANMARQNEKEADAQKHAPSGEPQVSDRNTYGGK